MSVLLAKDAHIVSAYIVLLLVCYWFTLKISAEIWLRSFPFPTTSFQIQRWYVPASHVAAYDSTETGISPDWNCFMHCTKTRACTTTFCVVIKQVGMFFHVLFSDDWAFCLYLANDLTFLYNKYYCITNVFLLSLLVPKCYKNSQLCSLLLLIILFQQMFVWLNYVVVDTWDGVCVGSI